MLAAVRPRGPATLPDMTRGDVATAHPAASILLVRDGGSEAEVLYLRRNTRLAFHGGSWVFPGGRIDAEDRREGDRLEDTARRAAVREAEEEAGLRVDPASLQYLCHWTTPETSPRRFATWFFLAPVGQEMVQVDGGEIHEHRWLTPRRALAAQRDGEMVLPAPTYALSTRLAGQPSVASVLAAVATWEPEVLVPRIHAVEGGRVALYQQDRGYESGDLQAPPPRHRMWMLASGWRYEREL